MNIRSISWVALAALSMAGAAATLPAWQLLRKTIPVAGGNETAPVGAPAKTNPASLPAIMGSVTYREGWTDNTAEPGLYDVSQPEPQLRFHEPTATGGGVLVGKTYYTVDYTMLFGSPLVQVHGYNINTGQETYRQNGSMENIFSAGMALDPVSGCVFGISNTPDGSGQQLARISFNGLPVTTPIAQLEGKWCAFAITGDGDFYGIRKTVVQKGDKYVCTSATLCSIGRNDGSVHEIGTTGELPHYVSHAAIDSRTDRMFWCVNPLDDSGFLCEVDLTSGQSQRLFDYLHKDNVVGMYVSVPDALPRAPGACTEAEALFSASSLDGHIKVKTPAGLFNGTENPEGEVAVHIYSGGTELAALNAPYNDIVEVPVSVPAGGAYDFVIYASNDNGRGPKVALNGVRVGSDTPKAPIPVLTRSGDNMTLVWTAVTTTVFGLPAPQGITYTVLRHDGTQAASGLTECSFTESVPEPESYTRCQYSVYACSGQLQSSAGLSNVLPIGPVIPRFSSDFDCLGFEGMTVVDANADSKTWEVSAGFAMVAYNSSKPSDDWLFTHDILLEAGKTYRLSFEAFGKNQKYTETLEVMYGNAPAPGAMDMTLLPPEDLPGSTYDNRRSFTLALTPPETGRYNIGFHAISAKNQMALFLSDFTIAEGVPSGVPAAPTDFKAEPSAESNDVHVSFNAPILNVAGTPLETITTVEIFRDGNPIQQIQSPSPGTALTFTDPSVPNGKHEYSARAVNTDGPGDTSSQSIYVGSYIPAPPPGVNLERTANPGEVKVSWNPVQQDINGHALTASEVRYNLYTYIGVYRYPVALGLTSCEHTFAAVAPDAQQYVQCGVFAETDAGEGEGAITLLTPVGAPYTSIHESFADRTTSYLWGTSAAGGGVWGLYDDSMVPDCKSQDGDNGFMLMKSDSYQQFGTISSGLVSLVDMPKPGLVFHTYNLRNSYNVADNNTITVQVRSGGSTAWETVFEDNVNSICSDRPATWGKGVVDLTAYSGKVIEFAITATVNNYIYTGLDNISVRSVFNRDMAVTDLHSLPSAKPGQEFDLTATVSNEGIDDAGTSVLTLTRNGELIASQEIGTMSAGTSATFTFPVSMDKLAEGNALFKIEINSTDDEFTANNSAETEVILNRGNLPAPRSLTGENADTHVALSWCEPDFDSALSDSVTESFEEGVPFANDFDGWIFTDCDNSPVGGFNAFEIPGIQTGITTGSFWIWDKEWSDLNTPSNARESYKAHSGKKFIFSLYRDDEGQADDWAISPELPGIEQTVSFYGSSYNQNYPETVEVWYSTGSTDPTDFIKIEGAGGRMPGGFDTSANRNWKFVEAILPEGARRFAIRSCAVNAFMLMIDDVTFIPAAAPDLQLTGYNVYRDGTLLVEEPVGDNAFNDHSVNPGDTYRYAVTALFGEKGESAASNHHLHQFWISGVAGFAPGSEGLLTVADTAGRILYKSPTAGNLSDLQLPSGIYIITLSTPGRKPSVRKITIP